MKGVRQTTFILVLLVAIFAWAALTYPGYFELEHGFRPLFNLTDLAEHWPAVGWVPTTGQPYDLLRGEGALPYWLALIPRALAGSSATAMRWFFIATVLAGTMGMYAWARRTLGAWPALIAAAVYALWPAGLATVYVRGAPAEATFLAIMPWTLWAVARASRTRADENLTPDLAPRRTGADVASPSLAGKGVGGSGAIFRAVPQAAAGATAHEKALLTPQFWGEPDSPQFWGEPDSPQSWGGGGAIFRTAISLTLGLAVLIWTHAGLSLWFALVLMGAIIFTTDVAPGHGPATHELAAAGHHRRSAAGMLRRLWPVMAGLALGAAGLLPVALRHGLQGKTYIVFVEQLISPYLFLWPGWNARTGTVAPSSELSFHLGLMACALALLGLLLPRSARPTFDVRRLTLHFSRFAVAVVLITVFLSSTLAAPLWRLLPFLQATLTAPRQLLLLAGPWLAWLAAAGARALFDQLPAERQEDGVPLVAACLLTLTLLASYGYLRPAPVPAPIPDAPRAIFGENEIALLEATPTILPPRGMAGPALQAGTTISVTVRWQALRPLARDYTVFLHLVDADGRLQGQQDTMPQDNKLPTGRWRPGQIVADQYHATLKPGAPAGEGYRVYLGLYLWQTGERLRVGADDKVLITP